MHFRKFQYKKTAKGGEGGWGSPVGIELKIDLKVMIKKDMRCLRKIRFKNYERKIKLQFMIYANFESILVPKDKGKQIPDAYTKNMKTYCL